MKPQDKRASARVKKGTVFNIKWIHADYLNYWLREFTSDGSLLNVCCGYSEIGYPRIDNSPISNRTHDGDLFNLKFPPESFDYVYCDPPFQFYTSGDNRFRWQFDLFKICKIALITRRPRVTANINSRWHDYAICEDSRPALTILRIDFK